MIADPFPRMPLGCEIQNHLRLRERFDWPRRYRHRKHRRRDRGGCRSGGGIGGEIGGGGRESNCEIGGVGGQKVGENSGSGGAAAVAILAPLQP